MILKNITRLCKKYGAEQTISEKAVSTVHILRGLISYHERMTMGDYPERDFYLDGLRFALACVEEKIK